MNDTPFPPPTPESEPEPNATTDPTHVPTEIPLGSPAADPMPADPSAAAPGPAGVTQPVADDAELDLDPDTADEYELAVAGIGRGPSHGRRTRLAIGAVGLGGLLAVSGWLALAGDGHADDTARVGAADASGVSDTTADEQLDATSQVDVDIDDDDAAGADGAPASGDALMPGGRGGHHGGGKGRGPGDQGQMGQQDMGATAATPGAAPTSGSGGS